MEHSILKTNRKQELERNTWSDCNCPQEAACCFSLQTVFLSRAIHLKTALSSWCNRKSRTIERRKGKFYKHNPTSTFSTPQKSKKNRTPYWRPTSLNLHSVTALKKRCSEFWHFQTFPLIQDEASSSCKCFITLQGASYSSNHHL